MVSQRLHQEFLRYHNCFCTLMLVHLGDIQVAEKILNQGSPDLSIQGRIQVACIKYSRSPLIDTPKIDTFYENSRNFQKSKIFGVAKVKISDFWSKSQIFGQNHQNNGLIFRYIQLSEF